MFEVTEFIFPLKDKGKGSELKNWRDTYEQNAISIKKEMTKFRDELGTKQFNAAGGRFFLDIWTAGADRPDSPLQMRWFIYPQKRSKLITVTLPVVDVIRKNSTLGKRVLDVLKEIEGSPAYDTFIEAEKKRIELNARSKANKKNLQFLDEVIDGQRLKQNLNNLILN